MKDPINQILLKIFIYDLNELPVLKITKLNEIHAITENPK